MHQGIESLHCLPVRQPLPLLSSAITISADCSRYVSPHTQSEAKEKCATTDVVVQKAIFPKCTVCITLIEDTNSAAAQDVEQAVKDIAEMQRCLRARGVDVLVQLHFTSTMQSLPEPRRLQRLAPILQSIQWPSLSAFAQILATFGKQASLHSMCQLYRQLPVPCSTWTSQTVTSH